MFCRRIISSFSRPKSVSASPVSGSYASPQSIDDIKEELRNDKGEETSVNPLDTRTLETPGKKERRVKHAMLLCYHGAKYHGMQFNLNCPSIEGELFRALNETGLVPKELSENARFHIGFNRASRTDAGVSALRQVVSIKLPPSANIQEINGHLPRDIRVLGLKRATKGFDAQLDCHSRSYCYIMPTYALCHYKNLCAPKETYRIPAETILMANEIFSSYVGSHKFHNYTEKRDCWDQRARRSILDVSFSEPFLFNDLEMVELHLKGYSFMLHQIRRMVGMTIALMVGRAPFHFLRLSLENQKLPAPTAPALGLMLEKQYFDHYNQRYGHIREPLEWNELDQEVDRFKMEEILPWIVKTEMDEDSMGTFLSDKLRRHSFSAQGSKEMNPQRSPEVKLGNWEDLEAVDKLLADETLPS